LKNETCKLEAGHRSLPESEDEDPPASKALRRAGEEELYLRRGGGFELYEGMRLVFETAREADATELAILRNEAAKKLTEKFGKGPWSSGCTEKGVLFGMRTSRMVIALEDGKIVGTLSLQTKKPWAIDPAHFTKVRRPLYLVSMFVAAEWQGQGIGRRLLEEAVGIAQNWPVEAIRLDAYDAKAGAGDFYSKCGFREVGRGKYKEVALRYFERIISLNG
jgi:GNAT superfamily N-acetyltransferase